MARDPYRYFRVEARELIDQLGKGTLGLEKGGGDDLVQQLLRLAHTLKGAARVVKLTEIAEIAHAIEGLLEPSRATGAVDPPTINGILTRLDDIGERVAMISTPEAPAVRQEPALPGRPSEAVHVIRSDVEEIDEVVNGIALVSSHLNALGAIRAQLVHASQLTEVLVQQSGRSRRAEERRTTPSDREIALAMQLRAAFGDVERSLGAVVDRMARDLGQLREVAEQARLVSAGSLFTALERTARDAAQLLGRRVQFIAGGGGIRLDPRVLGAVHDALTQLVRNAVAHGIEAPVVRTAAGKPEVGRITIGIVRRGRRIAFRCTDDGKGIDLEAVRRAAIAGGMSSDELDRLDSAGLARLILRGGITTAPSVTEIAGRGIGMDIVGSAAKGLGGEVMIDTATGRGTTIELEVPLSLASIEVLSVEAGGVRASVPLDSVRYTRRIDAGDLASTPQGDSLLLGREAIPFVPLARLVSGGQPARHASMSGKSAVVIAGPSGTAAVGVDRLAGTAEVILRMLPDLAPADRLVAGAALDVDGQPQLVLDAEGLIAAALDASVRQPPESAAALPVLVVDDSLTTRMLEQSILESAGYRVDVAASAEEGLDRARRQRYALFLVDVEMPGMDGFAFIERIRADAALQDIPAILVTSLASPESMQRGERAGAQGYMVKSEFDQSRLLAHIRQLTERAVA